MQKASIWTRDNTYVTYAHYTHKICSAYYQLNKLIPNCLRHSHPLTMVAVVGDVSLRCGGYRRVNAITPRHVRTNPKKICQFSRRQGRVFVLQYRTKHIFRIRKPKIKTLQRQKYEHLLHHACRTTAAGTRDLNDWALWCSQGEPAVWTGKHSYSWKYINSHPCSAYGSFEP